MKESQELLLRNHNSLEEQKLVLEMGAEIYATSTRLEASSDKERTLANELMALSEFSSVSRWPFDRPPSVSFVPHQLCASRRSQLVARSSVRRDQGGVRPSSRAGPLPRDARQCRFPLRAHQAAAPRHRREAWRASGGGAEGLLHGALRRRGVVAAIPTLVLSELLTVAELVITGRSCATRSRRFARILALRSTSTRRTRPSARIC